MEATKKTNTKVLLARLALKLSVRRRLQALTIEGDRLMQAQASGSMSDEALDEATRAFERDYALLRADCKVIAEMQGEKFE